MISLLIVIQVILFVKTETLTFSKVVPAPPGSHPSMYATKRVPMDATTVLMDVTLLLTALYATKTRRLALRALTIVKIPIALARLRVTLLVTLFLVVVSASPGSPAMHAT
jgi:hypothetical protein